MCVDVVRRKPGQRIRRDADRSNVIPDHARKVLAEDGAALGDRSEAFALRLTEIHSAAAEFEQNLREQPCRVGAQVRTVRGSEYLVESDVEATLGPRPRGFLAQFFREFPHRMVWMHLGQQGHESLGIAQTDLGFVPEVEDRKRIACRAVGKRRDGCGRPAQCRVSSCAKKPRPLCGIGRKSYRTEFTDHKPTL